MFDLYVRKNIVGHLEPTLPQTEELLAGWPVGDELMLKGSKPRNIKNHRRFFAFLNIVFENQKKYDNIDDVLVELKLRIGHYKEHVTLKGVVIYVPKSINFASMDELEFQIFFSNAIDKALEYFVPNFTEQKLRDWVEQIVSFS